MELTKPYTGQTADKNWESPLIQIAHLMSVPYIAHSGNTSRPVNLAVVRWLVSYEDENEYGNDNGNEMEDWPIM